MPDPRPMVFPPHFAPFRNGSHTIFWPPFKIPRYDLVSSDLWPGPLDRAFHWHPVWSIHMVQSVIRLANMVTSRLGKDSGLDATSLIYTLKNMKRNSRICLLKSSRFGLQSENWNELARPPEQQKFRFYVNSWWIKKFCGFMCIQGDTN